MVLDLVYGSPAWLLAAVLLVVGLGFALGCARLVRRLVPADARGRHGDLIGLAVTNVAVFYGVLLAFLTVAVWEDFSEASQSVNQEAALVGNMINEVHGLPRPLSIDLERHARTYLTHVVEAEWPMQAAGRPPAGTAPSLVELHRHLAAFEPADAGDAVVMGNMLRTLNELDAARAARLEALGGHVPALVWVLIVLMGLLTIALAAMFPADGGLVQATMLGGIVAATVAMLLMLVELDHPFRGAISVSSAPYVDLLAQLGPPSRMAVPR